MKWIPTLCVTAMLAIAGAVFAYPTLTGPTGLSVLPTVEITRGLTVAADYQKIGEGFGIPTRAVLGLTENIEVGALYNFLSSNTGLDKAYGANVKIRLTSAPSSNSAIGVQCLRVRDDYGAKTDYQQAYLVWTGNYATEDFPAFDISLGVNCTRLAPDVGDTTTAFRAFAGAGVGITDMLTLTAEFQTDSSELGDADPLTTVTLRYHPSDIWNAQVGFTNAFGLVSTDDHQVFGGIAFNFGAYHEHDKKEPVIP